MNKEQWLKEAKRLKDLYKSGEISLEEYNKLRNAHNAKDIEEIDDKEFDAGDHILPNYSY